MKPFSRSERVAGQIQQILSELLQKKINDPRLRMATITGVKMTRDLKIAYVYFTISGGDEKKADAIKGFKSAFGFIKRNLADKLGLRYMPEIKFIHDDSFDYGAHIDSVLKSLKSDPSS